MITHLISATIAATIGFGAAWTYQGKQLAEQDLAHANERITLQAAARKTIERNTSALASAQNNAASRVAVLRADADGARNAGHGLRIATDAAVRTASDSPDACNRVATACSSVVAASTDFIQTVVTDADQCHSDLTLMREAWPKN